ncbi:TerB family tellurite resistance protein [Shewanella colwelliana]|uniref:TerB family tellurite resistance protein n=1 Tax=Shewanella colwelliana TaxID=23 RepID=UPI00048CF651|nr:TerB family tellurite resistance protein [Shewanella colwelliana]
MDFDILDIICDATTEANAFEQHPAGALSMEEKVLYLNGLALVMNADGDIDSRESEYIRILIKSMGLDESSLDDVIAFAIAPDKDTVQAFFRAFRRKPIAQLFLFDALMMTRRDEEVADKETAVVNKIAEQLEILNGTRQDIFDLFCHIKNRNWQESALYFDSHLLNPEHFKHLLDYHEVDIEQLLTETAELRAKRILQALTARMPEPVEGENSKPVLDHEIVVPLLQAELDRGNASINNMVFESNLTEIGDIALSPLKLHWDPEACVISGEPELVVHSQALVKLLLLKIDALTASEAARVLYKGRLQFSKGVELEAGTLQLSSPLTEDFPYVQIDACLYKATQENYQIWNIESLYCNPDAGFSSVEQIDLWYEKNHNTGYIAGHLTKIEMCEYLEDMFNNGVASYLI